MRRRSTGSSRSEQGSECGRVILVPRVEVGCGCTNLRVVTTHSASCTPVAVEVEVDDFAVPPAQERVRLPRYHA